MKQVLSLLMAFTFLQVQTWALSGGPIYRSTGSPNQAGNYAGVLVQRSLKVRENLAVLPDNISNAGNIGVFQFLVPLQGATLGTTGMFIGGLVFIGTVQGVADPDEGTFTGIIQATGSAAIPLGTAFAQGSISANIVEDPFRTQAGRLDRSAGNAARLTGTAIVDAYVAYNNDLTPVTLVQARYTVTGFRQNTTPLPAVTP